MATSAPRGSDRWAVDVMRTYLIALAVGAAASVSIAAAASATVDCTGGIRSDCRGSGTSILLLKNPTGDNDKLTWKWLKGAATAAPEFGDPTTSTDYALCIYAGTSAGLIVEADVAMSSTLWTSAGAKGFKYTDAAGSADGIQKVVLAAGAAGKAKVLVKGKGANLPDPPAGPFSLPVTVQLVNSSTSVCFEAVYTAADVLKTDEEQFKAKFHTTCGDNATDGSEECDGTDDVACPGQCLSNCTCPVACGESGPACSGACPAGQSCGVASPCACGPANPTPCGSTAPTCNGSCPTDESCAADPLTGICYCVQVGSTPCANSLGSVPICGGVCPVGTYCAAVAGPFCTCL